MILENINKNAQLRFYTSVFTKTQGQRQPRSGVVHNTGGRGLTAASASAAVPSLWPAPPVRKPVFFGASLNGFKDARKLSIFFSSGSRLSRGITQIEAIRSDRPAISQVTRWRQCLSRSFARKILFFLKENVFPRIDIFMFLFLMPTDIKLRAMRNRVRLVWSCGA